MLSSGGGPMKNIKTIIALSMCSIALSACSFSFFSSTQPAKELKTISQTITVVYGKYVEGQVTYLFGDCAIPFNLEDYGVDYIAVGDTLTIYYTGYSYTVNRSSQPKTIVTEKMTVEKIEVKHTWILEFEMIASSDGAKSLKQVNDYVMGPLPTKVINEDGTFQEVDSYEVGSHFYGPAWEVGGGLTLSAYTLYSYNPAQVS